MAVAVVECGHIVVEDLPALRDETEEAAVRARGEKVGGGGRFTCARFNSPQETPWRCFHQGLRSVCAR